MNGFNIAYMLRHETYSFCIVFLPISILLNVYCSHNNIRFNATYCMLSFETRRKSTILYKFPIANITHIICIIENHFIWQPTVSYLNNMCLQSYSCYMKKKIHFPNLALKTIPKELRWQIVYLFYLHKF